MLEPMSTQVTLAQGQAGSYNTKAMKMIYHVKGSDESSKKK